MFMNVLESTPLYWFLQYTLNAMVNSTTQLKPNQLTQQNPTKLMLKKH